LRHAKRKTPGTKTVPGVKALIKSSEDSGAKDFVSAFARGEDVSSFDNNFFFSSLWPRAYLPTDWLLLNDNASRHKFKCYLKKVFFLLKDVSLHCVMVFLRLGSYGAFGGFLMQLCHLLDASRGDKKGFSIL